MTIDMHAHLVPPIVLEDLEKEPARYDVHLEQAEGGTCACYDHGLKIRPFFDRLLDLEQRWEEMGKQGIDRQILSVWADLFGYRMPADQGADWNRLLNERLSQVVQRYSERLSMLACMPLQNATLAAKELEYGVKHVARLGAL